ncbi:MAG: histidine kinase [Flavobacteriales bacterium]
MVASNSFDSILLEISAGNKISTDMINELEWISENPSMVSAHEFVRSLFLQANINFYSLDKEKATPLLERILAIKTTDPYVNALSQELLVKIEYESGDVAGALSRLKKVYSIDSSLDDLPRQIRDLVNISSFEHDLGLYDQSLLHQRHAIKLSNDRRSSFKAEELQIDLAPIFIQQNELDSAMKYLKQGFRIKDSPTIDYFGLLLNCGLLMEKKIEFDSAFAYYFSALENAQIENDSFDLTLALYNIAYLKNQVGDYREAFLFLDSMNTIDEKFRNAEFAKNTRELELKYQDLERDNELQRLEFKSETDEQLKLWGGISAALVISGLSGLFYTNRKRLMNARQLAIETKKRHKKETELVAMHTALETLELERKRAAMDLHDGIGALASAARMKLSQVMKRTSDESLQGHIREADGAMDEIARDVKRIARDMLPTTLSHLGLIATIDDFINRSNRSSEIEVSFFSDTDHVKLSESAEISIYRIVQELINNGLKYSEGSEIGLELNLSDKEIQLLYYDNGKGFNAKDSTEGNGRHILNSRVEFLSGTIDIQSVVSKGTTVKIIIPYEAQD